MHGEAPRQMAHQLRRPALQRETPPRRFHQRIADTGHTGRVRQVRGYPRQTPCTGEAGGLPRQSAQTGCHTLDNAQYK